MSMLDQAGKSATTEKKDPRLLAAVFLLVAAVFAADSVLPLGVAGGVPYVVPVALTLWFSRPLYTLLTAGICAVLVILDPLIKPASPVPMYFVFINRGYALLAIGMIVGIGHLRHRLAKQNRRLAAQAAALQALHDSGAAISSLLNINIVREQAVRRTRQLFNAGVAGLALLDEKANHVRWELLAADGFRRFDTELGQCLGGKAIRTGEPVRIDDATSDPEGSRLVRALQLTPPLRAALAVPLKVAARPIGALMVGYYATQVFDLQDTHLLTSLANQVAIAINNAQLYERLGALSALEERELLSRELHDDLSQSLSGIGALASAASELAAQGRAEDARQELDRLRDLAGEVFLDLRQFITGLRVRPWGQHQFLGALQDFARHFAGEAGLELKLEVPECADKCVLSPLAEVQAIRIAQEALTNTAKHAHARNLAVRVVPNGESMRIVFQDDGQGFDPAPVDTQSHLGLQIMRERAELAGGRLAVVSAPGRGTSVTLELPCEKRS
ncbi:MAG: GAF domain-containing sensor histidine kinase [Chloroflexi bacterium]|nr:GAF domain-containing sensor histidine kinase [Chloroflexota bacterium]